MSNETQHVQVTQEESHASYITVYRPISGWKAIMYWWNPGGFWEPWATGMSPYRTKDKAITEAKMWAEAEGLEYKGEW